MKCFLHCVISCIQGLGVLVVRTWVRVAVFEQVASVERGESWTGEIPCVSQQGPAVCGSLSSHGAASTGPGSGCRKHHPQQCGQWAQPRAQDFTWHFPNYFAVLAYGLLLCKLEISAEAAEGTYLWTIRILGSPASLSSLPTSSGAPALTFTPVLPWQVLQQLSPCSLCHAGSLCSFCTSWGVPCQPELPVLCQLGTGKAGGASVFSVCWCAAGVGSPSSPPAEACAELRDGSEADKTVAVSCCLSCSHPGCAAFRAVHTTSARNSSPSAFTPALWLKGCVLQGFLCVRAC